MIQLSGIVAPSFYALHNAVKSGQYTHYWVKGGRGSTKSSCISIEIILHIMYDSDANAVVLRQYATNLRESVFTQLQWAIDVLGVSAQWHAKLSPMRLIYKPTGQSIRFFGLDDSQKIKSTKFHKGYPRLIWFEELTQCKSAEEIRSVLQSLMRGGDKFDVFYSYNPPANRNHWVNREVSPRRADRFVHHSDYRSVPPAWLGQQFLVEAEHLRLAQPQRYAHEYLGEITGTGGEVFKNLSLVPITDDMIAGFDQLRRGVDWGYAVDPFAYNVVHLDATRRRLYVFFELHELQLPNRAAARLLLAENKRGGLIICDSAEPKSIAEFKSYGLWVRGAKKGPDSVAYGIKFLQDMEQIVIDPARCPHTAAEFAAYELERDALGQHKAIFPDRGNHHIDAVRYALDSDMTRGSVTF